MGWGWFENQKWNFGLILGQGSYNQAGHCTKKEKLISPHSRVWARPAGWVKEGL